jgi:hypothetical protein
MLYTAKHRKDNDLVDPLFYFDGQPCDHDSPEDILASGITTQGWYFWDETWANCNGPYSSYELCREKITEYGRYLNGE